MAAAALGGEAMSRQSSSLSRRSSNIREMWNEPDVFHQGSRRAENNDEEELMWAALERLPTYDRLRRGMLRQVTGSGRMVHGQVDITKLGPQEKKALMESVLKVAEQDNERFLHRLRNRIDRLAT